MARDTRSLDGGERMVLPPTYDGPILFALARDDRTIFVGWNIDWLSVFQQEMPADRQVYLRITGGDGSGQKSVPVEPMLGMHYLTTLEPGHAHRVEIGYYQPAGTWHSVAISDEVKMPQEEHPGIAEVDLATIPFHLRFQQLVDLLGATNNTPLARVVSKFQNSALRTPPNKLPPVAKRILRKFSLSPPAIAAARRDFEATDITKLAGRRRALLHFAGTSPSGGSEKNAGA